MLISYFILESSRRIVEQSAHKYVDTAGFLFCHMVKANLLQHYLLASLYNLISVDCFKFVLNK